MIFKTLLNKISETFSLIWLAFKVKLANTVEYFLVVFNYYRKLSFLKIDSSLLLSYLFANPFRISRLFLQTRGEENIYMYGETPLTTMDYISQQCGLKQNDRVFELGCGRGRSCFWLNQWIGCSVVGIDFVPDFISKAERVRARYHLDSIEFRLENLFESNLSGATAIYLYGTCYSDQEIITLIKRFEELPKGTKIITVSYSLLDDVCSAL